MLICAQFAPGLKCSPPNEIDRAADRKRQFDRHPTRHTLAED
jgi:hypothetical protein